MMAWLADPALQAVLHLGFAALFAQAALHKLLDPRGFVDALRGYALLPEAGLRPAAALLVALELALAVALLRPGSGALPALAGAALLLVYAAAIAAAWQRGLRDIDCGCGLGAARGIGPELVARNAGLALALVVAALPASGRPLQALDVFSIAAALAAAALLEAATGQAIAARQTLRTWRRPG